MSEREDRRGRLVVGHPVEAPALAQCGGGQSVVAEALARPGALEPGAYFGKDEVADYLERYAERFALPVQHGVRVTGMEKAADGFRLSMSAGENGATELRARTVVVASGATRVPAVPGFASGLDAGIRQLHSDEYRNPGSVAPGPVLVVGAGTSGAEIALELAPEQA